MTQSLAYWLGAIILAAIAVDLVLFGTDHLVFLGKKGLDMIDWMAFWR